MEMPETGRPGEKQNEDSLSREAAQVVDRLLAEPIDGDIPDGEIRRAERLIVALNRLVLLLERSKLAEFVELLHREPVLFWRSFLAGLCRGMGFALGFWLLSALALYILNILAELGIPVLGDFIAELMVYVESVLRSKL
ncbi:MAG: hypothetical protein IJB55_01265 [Firmicutes bacterium]|nr:hypothetical protein [Bacillota bacterium]